METENDRKYMLEAIQLAENGKGKVNPNPLVGAVLVHNEKIIGSGYHQSFGGHHAEVNAIANTTESVENATLYVSLEPCSHFGKTPPCIDLIIKNKIRKVVVALTDPNPQVNGNGIAKLRDAGIEVITGICEAEAREQNKVFFKFIATQQPYIVLKAAMTLDGKIATHKNHSQWITGPETRTYVHQLRNELSGIMLGVNTVITDNPELTCRLPEGGRNPRRIVVDSKGRIPLDAKILQTPIDNPIIFATTKQCSIEIREQLANSGHTVLVLPSNNNRVDLNSLILELGKMQIDGILLEGGGTLNEAALQAGIVDEVQILIAPLIIGGKNALTPVEGCGVAHIDDGIKLQNIEYKPIGKDILISGKLKVEN